ncbi:hypothetical protein GCM10010317_077520 [Streptomyces mirabilis]|nr:hypothetical protein GCM10010317_077520 [Streptomyces mirabilis]
MATRPADRTGDTPNRPQDPQELGLQPPCRIPAGGVAMSRPLPSAGRLEFPDLPQHRVESPEQDRVGELEPGPVDGDVQADLGEDGLIADELGGVAAAGSRLGAVDRSGHGEGVRGDDWVPVGVRGRGE